MTGLSFVIHLVLKLHLRVKLHTLQFELTLYDLDERISSFGENFDFKIRRDHGKNFLMSAAFISR